ncbi:RsmD family RNA methyltransferase, partial [Magnetococcales bacterium HHB-1]
MLRIVTGQFKGRRLKSPRFQGTRPTSEKLRGSLYNMLAGEIIDAWVLDCFSGTGAMALEAISRGAKSAVMVEQGGAAFRLIRENIKQCGAEQASWPVRGSATKKETFIKIVQRIRAKQQLWSGFNLVILDPPYRQDDGSSSIHCIEQVDHLLAKDAY